MSAFIASLEMLASKYQSLFSFVIVVVFVWLAASMWNGLNYKVDNMRTDEFPKVHEEIRELRQDFKSMDGRLHVVETDVKQLKDDMREVRKDIADMKGDMAEIKATLNLVLKKLP